MHLDARAQIMFNNTVVHYYSDPSWQNCKFFQDTARLGPASCTPAVLSMSRHDKSFLGLGKLLHRG